MRHEELISSDMIFNKLVEVAEIIGALHKSKELVVIGVLNGSYMLVADFVRLLNKYFKSIVVDFIRVHSYGDGTVSNKTPRICSDVTVPIKDKEILIVDDIIDTGYSLQAVIEHMMKKEPYSIATFVLLNKLGRREVNVEPGWVGFEVPNEFVVGYGLDYAGKYRSLDHIEILTDVPD